MLELLLLLAPSKISNHSNIAHTEPIRTVLHTAAFPPDSVAMFTVTDQLNSVPAQRPE
jgi:hypothetical protein